MRSRLIVLIAAIAPLAQAADVRIVEEIIAKVNGDIITRGEMEQARTRLMEEAKSQGLTGAQLAEVVRNQDKNALRDQIDQLLLVQRGKDLDVKVDADVTRRLAEIQSQSKITDPDKFHDYIREQTGMSFEDFQQQMKNTLLTQKVIGEEISSRISIPEADLRKYYEEHQKEFVREEQVFLSQILLSTEGKTPAQVAAAQKKAADLVTRARKGEKFSDLARQNSDDPATAKDGGQLPPYKRSEHLLVKEIEDLVFQQKRGYVTDAIKLPQYLLILKVDDHYEAGQASFEEVKEQITQKLAEPKMEPKVREYLTNLRQNAFLQIKDGYVDAGAAPGKDTRWKDVIQLKPETTTKEEVAAKRKRKLLKVIPLGTAKSAAGATPAATTPAATTPPPPDTPPAKP
ncbi:MAG: peptidylprolyl isomerase [Acidobacteriota bacterium]|jgi:parvulin-like peptidyl-prolyl isomerase|nr:peptidylprolyl isomerase [Acidobacteriota bacterium]